MKDELPDDADPVLEGDDELSLIAKEVGAAAKIASHLEKDEEDVCGYCGQAFGPDDIVVEREIYGRKWRFCDETCLRDFQEKSDFKDEDLDGEPEKGVNLEES